MISVKWFRMKKTWLGLILLFLLQTSLAETMDLQVVAEQAIIDVVNPGGLGAIVAMDMRGQVIAQADQGNNNLEYPLAFNHRSTPGAVFRPITVLAALFNGVLDPEEQISDVGAFVQYNVESPLFCWLSLAEIQHHHNLNYIDAIFHDCYFFCYSLGARLGVDGERLSNFADTIGLTSTTGNETKSFVGNQQVLFDTAISLDEQETEIPLEVHSALIEYLSTISHHSLQELETCALNLMEMAVHNDTGFAYQNWESGIMQELRGKLLYEANKSEIDSIIEILSIIKWNGTNSIEVSNGQSRLIQCTPISIARVYTMIANGGFLYIDGSDQVVSDLSQSIGQYLPHIKEAIHGNRNRYTSLDEAQLTVSWITQNADNICSVLQLIEPSAEQTGEWYVCIAPYDAPEIVVVAYTEDCATGSAISLVDQFLKAYFAE